MAERGQARQTHRSDPALVQACLDGDERAWADLVDRYGRLVFSVARRSGLDADDADDVFQNVFVTLLRRLGGLRDQTRLSAWLITTAHRESWRVARQRRPGGTSDLDEQLPDGAIPPEEEIARLEREQAVREALDRLDARCRDLLTALFLAPDEPDYAEIGRRLGMPVGSIGPTRARCFRKLEVVLVESGFGSADG